MELNQVNGYTIIQAARKTGRELTQKQVNQIQRRREQLVKEGRNLSRDKQHQINAMWDWWWGIGYDD